MKFNTLAEVPAAIASFYTENLDGEETSIIELPRQDLKSWGDVELVKQRGRVPVVTHFITKACESDNWTAHDKYIAWLEKEPLADDEKYLLTTLVDDVETLVHSFSDDTTEWQAQEPAVTLRDATQLITTYVTEQAISSFKASRETMIEESIVDANGFQFDADEVSIARMSFYTVALINELDTYQMQWSLADTNTGVMTDITLGDLRLAQQLAVANMASVWGI